MGIILIVLLSFSVLLLLVSIFQKDPIMEVKEEVDQLTLQQAQDFYQIKKRLKVLEEELMLSDDVFPKAARPMSTKQKEIHEIIKNQVWALAQQGKPIEQIASQSSLTSADVYAILKEYTGRDVE